MKSLLLKYLPPVLGLLVLIAIIAGLHHALRHVGLHDVFAALAATPRREVFHALGLLALSLCFMMLYDVPGILFARRVEAFPKLQFRRIALASFCAYTLSHVLGAPAISAAAVRLRLYAQWQVPPSGIARIVAISGTLFSIGFVSLLGSLLLLRPLDVPLFGHEMPSDVLRLIGAALVAAILFYVAAARNRASLRVLGREIELPGLRLALLQVALACADTSTAAAILYTVLPDGWGLTFPHVLGVYLAAFGGGLVSGLPGGVGVFDSVRQQQQEASPLLLGVSDVEGGHGLHVELRRVRVGRVLCVVCAVQVLACHAALAPRHVAPDDEVRAP